MVDRDSETVYCRLMARGLDLPEETLVNIHGFDDPGHSSGMSHTLTACLVDILLTFWLRVARFMK